LFHAAKVQKKMESTKSYIQRCLQLARLGAYYVAPNPMVGAILVRHDADGDVILGEGWHEAYGAPHAEPNCIRHAEEAHPEGIDYQQCTLYVSLEPCSHYGKTPPCAELIIRKGIGRVVVGTLDPNPQVAGRGVRMMQEAGIEVVVGVEETACRELNKRFFCLQEKHRPYVILKWAQTADGYIDRLRGDETMRQDPQPMRHLLRNIRSTHLAVAPCHPTRRNACHWGGMAKTHHAKQSPQMELHQ
jgi:diaminohydroxyphosphoribosylaminopyrimidine deaminase/5-amino-6-(5-phosphoribosylamino)uracil reductase